MALATARLKMIFYPDPRLRGRCKPVERFDEELAHVAARMIELMREHSGLGLAAPQVGLAWRLFVSQPGKDGEAAAYVNPELSLEGDDTVAEEGCLSIPDVHVDVRRSSRCVLSARDVQGRPIRATGEGLMARIWQHEADHLDGRLIIDRMTEAEKVANRKLLRELEREFKGKKRPK